MNNFRDLQVWQKSILVVKKVYELTSNLPKEEIYGLTNQMRRSAVSMPSNIAEGAGRSSDADFNHFLAISIGSSFELETQLIICKELGYINTESLDELIPEIQEIQKMIRGLQKSLKH
ncbi:MAG: four helix bundle protein [Bacteroidetes bacterium GWF2_42_66]|nr:MAG: four helix bundle protein [Bacteroidetes bacterium GWA2_42_15]OFY02172.1 MAG: four helix bundle protein [Bacteroidetes bacterium GWE2_42_39]OFY43619.1 MAG: four helix bundle protein [Bacteroidetes bacterium GWF2_42_66]HBL75252.1 hypothetical protein [Prolixibacteraceae bacterium]HCR92304.1 hypothetical protein [Prolixibacteraceae bacterium]